MEELLIKTESLEVPEVEQKESSIELSPINEKINRLADEIIPLQQHLREGGYASLEINQAVQNVIDLKLEIIESLRDIIKLETEKAELSKEDLSGIREKDLEINSRKMYIKKLEESIQLEEEKIPKN